MLREREGLASGRAVYVVLPIMTNAKMFSTLIAPMLTLAEHAIEKEGNP